MAKTISQSITSIETTETSLESSLSKCKTSISNKGVSVSSSAGFSNLPALIDKIDTDPFNFRVSHPYADNMVSKLNLYLYHNGSLSTQTVLNSGLSYNFKNLDESGTNFVEYRDTRSITSQNLRLQAGDGYVLDPITFIVVSDNIDDITLLKLTDENRSHYYETFEKADYFYWCQAYHSNGSYLYLNYRDGSQTLHEDIALRSLNYPHIHVIYLDLPIRKYSEYTILSNDFNTIRTKSMM